MLMKNKFEKFFLTDNGTGFIFAVLVCRFFLTFAFSALSLDGMRRKFRAKDNVRELFRKARDQVLQPWPAH
jgi:hypothetical protein